MRHRPDLGLAHVLPSAAAGLGASGFVDDLGVGSCTVAVVCLVDGLGAELIEDHAALFDSLADAEGGSIEAAFPTTTPTGLATLGTGRTPGQHGIVGASFWLPEEKEVLSPLHWGHNPAPLAVQPEATVFERLRDVGIPSATIAPQTYSRSGLTLAVLRGSQYYSADDVNDRTARLREVLTGKRPSLVYVYWSALDRAAHEFGITSPEWRRAASDVNSLLWQIRQELPTDGVLLVTADHGMVDCVDRVWIEDQPLLTVGVRVIAGEPRMRHIYVDPEYDTVDVVRRWQEVMGAQARVVERHEAIASGLFGHVEPGIDERIGDFIAIAQGGAIMASRTFDERVSRLRGHHGALTDAERRVPGLVIRG
jgi:hypothetical protein